MTQNSISSISTLAAVKISKMISTNVQFGKKNWLSNFNGTKCVVLKIRQSLNYAYTLNGEILEVVEEQKGITIYENLKRSTHIKYITTKANQCIGLIKRCFESRWEKIINTLYETMIRPVLEYASPAWNPFYRKDIDELEKVQKRDLKLSTTPVESVPLEQRRLEADLGGVYKYLSGLNRNNPKHFFYQCSSSLGGHSLKLTKTYRDP